MELLKLCRKDKKESFGKNIKEDKRQKAVHKIKGKKKGSNLLPLRSGRDS